MVSRLARRLLEIGRFALPQAQIHETSSWNGNDSSPFVVTAGGVLVSSPRPGVIQNGPENGLRAVSGVCYTEACLILPLRSND